MARICCHSMQTHMHGNNLQVIYLHIYSHIYVSIYFYMYVLCIYMYVYVCVCTHLSFHPPIHASIDLSSYLPTHSTPTMIKQGQSFTEIQSPKDPQRQFKNKECYSQRYNSPRQHQQKELSWKLIPIFQLQVQFSFHHTTLSFAQIFVIQMDRY